MVEAIAKKKIWFYLLQLKPFKNEKLFLFNLESFFRSLSK